MGGKAVTVEELGPPINVPELGIRGIPPGFEFGSPNLNLFSTVPNIAGQTDVWEWYTEFQLPVLETALGPGGSFEQRIDVNAAFRQSDYDRSGTSDSWKIGLDYRFHRDWRIRLTQSRDVREPTFSELFDASGGGPSVSDPRFNNASFNITSIAGGNPNLAPEKADTVVASIVWQPTFTPWIDGLQVSLDYYDVVVNDQIDQLGVQRIVDECELRGVQSLYEQIQSERELFLLTTRPAAAPGFHAQNTGAVAGRLEQH